MQLGQLDQLGQLGQETSHRWLSAFATLDAEQRSSLIESQLQLSVWQGATQVQQIAVTVKALQLRNGKLSLLAVGASLPAAVAADQSTLIAITPNRIGWAQPAATLTLNDLALQPVWQQTLIPQLWQDLQTAQLVSPAVNVANNAIANHLDDDSLALQTLGGWSVQQMELTGDQSLEAVLTIEPADSEQIHTVIFSNQKILYSDLQTPAQSVVTIVADVDQAELPTLLVKTAQGLRLQQWSSQNQQFESN